MTLVICNRRQNVGRMWARTNRATALPKLADITSQGVIKSSGRSSPHPAGIELKCRTGPHTWPSEVPREVRCVRCLRPLNLQTEIIDVQKHRLIRENMRSTQCFAQRHRHRHAVAPPWPGLRPVCTSRPWLTCLGTPRSRSPATCTGTPATTPRARRSTGGAGRSDCETTAGN